MKILLPAVASSSKPDGISRHAVNVAQCLLHRSEIERIDLVVGVWQRDCIQSMLDSNDKRLNVVSIPIRSSSWSRNRWYWNDLPVLAAELKSDLVHAAYPVPLRRTSFYCPIVVTLHDLYPYDIPVNFGLWRVFFNRTILRQCLSAADAIACVSESTLQRLHLYVPPRTLDKATTIYNCLEPKWDATLSKPFLGWQGEKFLLSVAQHRRNKNVLLTLQIFRELLRSNNLAPDSRLLIVGISGPETPRIERFIRESGLGDRVVLLDGISDADLGWCYRHCELLLATSSIEGFGRPIVEAMLHQCRVVCSDISAFREVGGAYCDYVSLQSTPLAAFVEASSAALTRHKFRRGSIECFSRSKIADAYLALYNRLLNAAPSVANLDAAGYSALIEERKQ